MNQKKISSNHSSSNEINKAAKNEVSLVSESAFFKPHLKNIKAIPSVPSKLL